MRTNLLSVFCGCNVQGWLPINFCFFFFFFSGGTLKIYGESLCRDVPYKTLLLSIRDCAQAVVREMLAKYGLDKTDPLHYCLVQVSVSFKLHARLISVNSYTVFTEKCRLLCSLLLSIIILDNLIFLLI